MKIERLELGMYASNCYIVSSDDAGEGVIIDPGDAGNKIVEHLNELGLAIKYIVLTHGHPDHIGGVAEVKAATGAELAIHSADVPYLRARPGPGGMLPREGTAFLAADWTLQDGDKIETEGLYLEVIHTPGHTPGGICLLSDGVLFSGDTLFYGSIGRSDFPGGNGPQLIKSIQTRLMALPDETAVLPGHGPETSIGNERANNPFLRGQF